MRMKAKAIATILFLIFIGWQTGLMRGHKSREALTKAGVKLACRTEVLNSLAPVTALVTKNLES